MGGIVKAVSEGAVQREVAYQAWKTEKGFQDGLVPKVGVNKYRTDEEEHDVELHPYKPEQADESIRRTQQIRAGRNQSAVTAALTKVREAAANSQNVMPAMMEAVKAYATLGEITAVLKQVFGAFREPVRL
jgi:methylmalonyl-CoA mutase N-terminal domain/subunit